MQLLITNLCISFTKWLPLWLRQVTLNTDGIVARTYIGHNVAWVFTEHTQVAIRYQWLPSFLHHSSSASLKEDECVLMSTLQGVAQLVHLNQEIVLQSTVKKTGMEVDEKAVPICSKHQQSDILLDCMWMSWTYLTAHSIWTSGTMLSVSSHQ